MRKFFVIVVFMVCFFNLKAYASERLSLGYIYAVSKPHTEIIDATNNSINVVSPTCFDLNSKGRLKINNMFKESVIEDMHARNIKVTPFLSNHWGRKSGQAALKNSEALVEDIVDAIIKYNLDGINVDLENLTPNDKDKLTNFIKLLRESLPEDKTVSIAVAANPERITYSWVAAYDYKALAEHVDYLVVMTYDEHAYAGSEGPVASIGFVEKSIVTMLEEVSKDKIVVGIPLYGRFWKVGEDVGGEAIIMGQMPNILKKYKLVPKYDVNTATPSVTLKVKANQCGPYVNGRYLDEGTYRIYYENENSIKAKLELVNKYDLLGAGLWALDNENSDFWRYYKDSLNATPYESEEEYEKRKEHEMLVNLIINQPFETINVLPDSLTDLVCTRVIIPKVNSEEVNKGAEVILPEKRKIRYSVRRITEREIKIKLANQVESLASASQNLIHDKVI